MMGSNELFSEPDTICRLARTDDDPESLLSQADKTKATNSSKTKRRVLVRKSVVIIVTPGIDKSAQENQPSELNLAVIVSQQKLYFGDKCVSISG